MNKQHEDRDGEVERLQSFLKNLKVATESKGGRANMRSLFVCVCAFTHTHTHPGWHSIRQRRRDLTLTDSRSVHYHTTLVSISISRQSWVSENQKAAEQPRTEGKIKYVTIKTKHHILGFRRHNKQARRAKEVETPRRKSKTGCHYSPMVALSRSVGHRKHASRAESMWRG